MRLSWATGLKNQVYTTKLVHLVHYSDHNLNSRQRVAFINCFAPCADLSRPAPNNCASKKLLKNWAQGAKVGGKGAKPVMKSTQRVCYSGHQSHIQVE